MAVSVTTTFSGNPVAGVDAMHISERVTRIPISEVERLLRAAISPDRPDLSSVLWDVDIASIDEEAHSRFIIRRIRKKLQVPHVLGNHVRKGRPLRGINSGSEESGHFKAGCSGVEKNLVAVVDHFGSHFCDDPFGFDVSH